MDKLYDHNVVKNVFNTVYKKTMFIKESNLINLRKETK